mmetsp:Transcript_19505/g.41141  ORF Transcript_19505/g.41141 Transcript_19505/m.41141 type:complete len:663 (-) Transcript_19505:124-2112(-)
MYLGFEACWKVQGIAANTTFQVHFNRCEGEETTSTGKDVGGKGQIVCLTEEAPHADCSSTPITTTTSTPFTTTSDATVNTPSTDGNTNDATTTTCPQLFATTATTTIAVDPQLAAGQCGSSFYDDLNLLTDGRASDQDQSWILQGETPELTEAQSVLTFELSDANDNDACKKTRIVTWTAETSETTCTETLSQSYTFEDKTPPVMNDFKSVPENCGEEHLNGPVGPGYGDGTSSQKPYVFEAPSAAIGTGSCNSSNDLGVKNSDANLIIDGQFPDDLPAGIHYTRSTDASNRCDIITTTIWRAYDGCGNYAEQEDHYHLVDEQKPVIDAETFPADASYFMSEVPALPIPTDAGHGPSVVVHDICDDTDDSLTTDLEFCERFQNLVDDDNYDGKEVSVGGMVSRCWTATDNCNNVSEEHCMHVTLKNDCSFSVQDAWSGANFGTHVLIRPGGHDENLHPLSDHAYDYITITVTNADTLNKDGDIRGVFFDMLRDQFNAESADFDSSPADSMEGIQIKIRSLIRPDADDTIEEPQSTNFKCDTGGVDRIARDVLMKGGGRDVRKFYSCGVEVGSNGIRGNDDFKQVIFDVYHPDRAIYINDIDGGDFGVRRTSVTDCDSGVCSNSREDSSKVNGQAQCKMATPDTVTLEHPCSLDSWDHGSVFN